MSRWPAVSLALVLALCASMAQVPHAAHVHAAAVQQQVPLFRSSTDLVTVDAFAHRDRQPIAGLTGDDFIVRDNGVEQQIEAMGTTDSAHVVIGLDLSGSVDGAALDRLRAGVRALLAQLTERDRLSVFTFADRVRILARAELPSPRLLGAIDDLSATGATPLHDAIVMGTTLAAADSRPAVFLLFTDGQDTASWNTAARALDMLRRGNVVVYPVGAGLASAVMASASSDYFRHPTWLAPYAGDTLRLLESVAETSGGEFLRVGREERLVETFSGILARYRQRYLLSYTPAGVGRDDGWHRLDVRLRRRPGSVAAREGYMAAPTPAGSAGRQ